MPAWLIADIDVTDTAGYDEYRRRVPEMVGAYGWHFGIRGGPAQALEGAWPPHRVVVIEFASMERLLAFYDSAEYAPVKALRMGASDSRMIAVDGDADDAGDA
jgi:uncharacterized protein (DUF1330 family)